MSLENKSLALVLSLFTVLGPVSYVLAALFEIGRLGYFNAPTGHLQITSFGIKEVAIGVYPTIIPLIMVVVLFLRLRFLQGRDFLISLIHAVGFACGVLAWFSATPKWQMIFGAIFFIAVIVTFFHKSESHEVGNEKKRPQPLPQTAERLFYRKVQHSVLLGAGVLLIGIIFIKAGSREAAREDYYWCVDKEVVIGFYGNNVLLANLSGQEVGEGFRFREMKELKGDLVLRRVGPLKPAPQWLGK